MTLAWLVRPAPEGARRVALDLLAQADEARRRLAAPEPDPEALHDFRVALRRLRSWIRAFRPQLEDTLTGKARRRLGRIADATGAGRDAEVLLALLGSLRPRSAAERAAVAELRDSLEARQREANDDVARAAGLFDDARDGIEAGLSAWMQPVARSGEPSAPLAAVLAARLREQAAALGAALAAADAPERQAEAHAARIAGKRVRYLLEPLARTRPATRSCVRSLRALQDLLGEMHDAHVLELEARELATRLPGPGAAELVARLGRRVALLHGRLRREWLAGGSGKLVRDLERVAAALSAEARAGLEHERKFLLSALPPRALRGRKSLLEQGWLPGRAIVERLRRERGAGRVRHWRTIKAGRGVSRIEAEEPIDAALFRALWPATRGCRVRKERFVVRDGGHAWEIDRFLDRALVLAEVELPDAETVVQPPAWLAPFIVREVTGEDAFVNRNLAR